MEDLIDLNVTACTSECEPYFEISFEVCFADGTCFILEDENDVVDNILATCITPPFVQLQSNKFMFDDLYCYMCYKHRKSKCMYINILIIH